MRFFKGICLVIALIILLFGNLSDNAYAQEVNSAYYSLSVSKEAVNVGDTITVTIYGNNIENVFAYELLLSFNSDKLELQGVPESHISENSNNVYSIKGDELLFGSTNMIASTVSGKNVKFSTLKFKATALGTATIEINWVKTFDMNLKAYDYIDSEPATEITISRRPASDEITQRDNDKEKEGAKDKERNIKDQEVITIDEEQIAIDILPEDGISSYSFTIPEEVWWEENKDKMLYINSPVLNLEFPVKWLEKLRENEDNTVEIRLEVIDSSQVFKEVLQQVGNRPIVNISLIVNGEEREWCNPDFNLLISIPYMPTPEELDDPEHIVVFYLTDDGEMLPISTGRYDEQTVRFYTNNLNLNNRYAVGFYKKSYKDIEQYQWAKKAIDVLASKGIIEGIDAYYFGPDHYITRAEFLTCLIKVLGLTAIVDENFTDVSENEYYYEPVGIGKKLGITKGIDGYRFSPEMIISRQDMIVMTCRAMETAGIELDSSDTPVLDMFFDKDDIAPYATDSIAKVVKKGIIVGSGGYIKPLKSATRAEAAVILYRVMKLK